MPLEEDQAGPDEHDSLIYDNRVLMEIRKHNLGHPLSPSMQNTVRSVRILSDLAVEKSTTAQGEICAQASVIAVIYHRRQDVFAGNVNYRLVRPEPASELKIKSKRVDLLNADAPLDTIMMYI